MISCLLPAWCAAALIEEVVQIPVEVKNKHRRTYQQWITVTVFRDDAREKSPFMILNHGRAVNANGRAKLGRARYSANSAYFTRQGFAVFVLTRIGYGVSGGADVEDTGVCNHKDYPPGYEAAVAQSVAVIDYAKSRRYVDENRGIVLGQSYGGTTAVALAAKKIDGVLGAVNFAGGGGGNPETRPGNPCAEPQLRDLFANYGKTARAPTLWLYSENDRYWGPDYPQRWFAAFRAAGGVGKFAQLAAYGKDGHGSFTSNPNAWKPHFEAFIQSIGFAD